MNFDNLDNFDNFDKEGLPCMNPVENYKAPQIPTREDTSPVLLKRLPSRWQRNATVIASLGFAGAFMLTGCASPLSSLEARTHNGGFVASPFYVAYPTEQDTNRLEDDLIHHGGTAQYPLYVVYPTEQEISERIAEAELNLRVHFGGSGSGPFYVVHFTEQEALGIIRAKLEAAGLNFDATPPEHAVEFWPGDVGLDLFDEEKGIAIAHISWEDSNMPFTGLTRSVLTDYLTEKFAEMENDILVGVFYNHGETIGEGKWWEREYGRPEAPDWIDENGNLIEEFIPDWWSESDREWWESRVWWGADGPTPEAIEAARPALKEHINTQVQEFIDFLQAEGILQLQELEPV